MRSSTRSKTTLPLHVRAAPLLVGAAPLLVGVVALLALSGAAGRASAQGSEPTLNELALQFAGGEFGSPLICQIDGEPLRGLRRIAIAPPTRPTRPPAMRISFVDLEIEAASRCFTELDGDVPNVTGWVDIRLRGKHRPDTAQRDLREAMRRKRGFEYEIVRGALRIQRVTQPPSEPKTVRFAGGTALLVKADLGSDSARLLASFRGPRKLLLELEAQDGTKLSFPLYVPEAR